MELFSPPYFRKEQDRDETQASMWRMSDGLALAGSRGGVDHVAYTKARAEDKVIDCWDSGLCGWCSPGVCCCVCLGTWVESRPAPFRDLLGRWSGVHRAVLLGVTGCCEWFHSHLAELGRGITNQVTVSPEPACRRNKQGSPM